MTTAIVEHVDAAVYRFPTPHPESDGTLEWDATVAVTVTIACDGLTGVGWTYSSPAAAVIVCEHFATLLRGRNVFDVGATTAALHRAARNLGTTGLVMQAISAIDVALWDLKAKLLEVSVVELLGSCRSRVPIYGSGGFTSASDAELAQDVAAWKAAGCTAMKIKIGRGWGRDRDWDLRRVALLRELAGGQVDLMVDANGAYRTADAVRLGRELERLNVRWFEEPVSSDDTDGLALVRSSLQCEVAAGEYIDSVYDAERLVAAVDCLQVDATRCGGYTGFLALAAVAAAHNREVSAHCAPALHAPVAAAIPHLRHVEWFNDHVRLEPLLLTGLPPVDDGTVLIGRETPGHGMSVSGSADGYRVEVTV